MGLMKEMMIKEADLSVYENPEDMSSEQIAEVNYYQGVLWALIQCQMDGEVDMARKIIDTVGIYNLRKVPLYTECEQDNSCVEWCISITGSSGEQYPGVAEEI